MGGRGMRPGNLTKPESKRDFSRRSFIWLAGAAFLAVSNESALALFKKNKDGAATQNFSNTTPGKKKLKATTETQIVENEREAAPMIYPGADLTMLRAIAWYDRIVQSGGWPMLAPTDTLEEDSEGPEVAQLKQRLAIEGYLAPSNEFDETFDKITEDAVRRFQRNHGLAPSGKIDNATVEAMNVPAEVRLATLRSNLQRVEVYAKDLEDRYIIVNIPAAQLETVSGRSVYSRHNIIAGKPDRPSPVVITKISDLNFNPYWHAPASIVARDIIPDMLKNPKHLQKLNIKVFDGAGGPEIDPATIDWTNTAPDRYLFRQEPGGENAMATVKINFPSPFGVYMHDTPTKQLFAEGQRYFSSGCVRVDKVQILEDWILRGQDGWDMDRIQAMAESGERLDYKVMDGPQVRWVYLTAWVTDDGGVHFRPDIYELDGSGFVLGQPLPVGQGSDGQRWTLQPAPFGYDEASTAAPPPIEPEETPSAIPVKKTNKRSNFNQPSASVTTMIDGVPGTPAFGQDDPSN